ncbi:uncharacterized protein LOC111785403 [Cucurbita pepo subsp. pepo]|uniref:uncharacterized protein LOC111785403 n=2 Tax=Cucurbita pepo subsp. pepo TaxID=3664 RepID=UPI000C9D7806|nr:uncharacterized protein LOC111785403 [Cucurbita pepo subsp. pepo]
MINLYRKSLYSFMSFADTFSPKSAPSAAVADADAAAEHPLLGLGLISDNNLTQFKSPNILESSSVLKPLCSSPATPRQDPGGVGFLDAVGGGVDGLMSCTESLGFESSDERLVNDEMMGVENGGDSGGGCTVRVRRRRVVVRRFPPPLTSLNQHGHPNFYLRSVRKDGRLELTEVKIERTEILRACREDGRLRLHLIKDEDEEEEDRIEEEEVEEDGFVKEGQVEFRRCVEVVNHQRRREHHRGHHHRNLDVWRQHCVTTS